MNKTALIITTIAALSAVTSVHAEDSYQQRVLFNPSENQLDAESRGHIMIYDGMQLSEVNRAMDEHYDRIENMMFVRTVIPIEFGDDEVEEDGCD